MPELTPTIDGNDRRPVRTLIALALIGCLSLASTCPPAPEPDDDGDGLSNAQEVVCASPVSDFDQDGDGLSDGAEVLILGTDPCLDDGLPTLEVGLDPADSNMMRVAGEAVGQPDDPAASVDGAIVWKDIPYAKPPVGALRFEPPDEDVTWSNLPDVEGENYACWQAPDPLEAGFSAWTLSEDCLRLDVVTPLSAWPPPSEVPPDDTRELAPVMVWIHGGGFVTGSKNGHDWSGFAGETGTVVVSINYRLGALGFFSHAGVATSSPTEFVEFRGNQGLRDQIAALRWVKAHIHEFGGNPNKVTIFGTSAGGTSVMALVATDATDGLFHRAIAQSPGIANQLPGFATPSKLFIAENLRGQHVSEALECSDEMDELSCLRTRSADAFLSDQVLESDVWPLLTHVPQHLPSIDDQLLTEQPATTLSAHRKVPMIIGTAGDEADALIGDAEFLASGGEFLDLLDESEVFEIYEGQLADGYAPSSFENGSPGVPGFDPSATRARNRLYSDILFHCPALAAAAEAADSSPAYVYHLDYTSKRRITSVPAQDESECGLPAPNPSTCNEWYELAHACEEPTEGTQWQCVGTEAPPDPDSSAGDTPATQYGWECRTPAVVEWSIHSSETSYLTGSFGLGGACTPDENQANLKMALRTAWSEFAATDAPEAFAPVGLPWPAYTHDASGGIHVDWIRRSSTAGVEGLFSPWRSIDDTKTPWGEERCALLMRTLFGD